MQTFLPYACFARSASVLDWRRLGKQRAEAKQILQALLGSGSLAWRHHPAVHMWRGYEHALCLYGVHICTEWRARDYRDTVLDWFSSVKRVLDVTASHELPHWLGDARFHIAHRSNLIRKQPSYYAKLWPSVAGDIPYVWPV